MDCERILDFSPDGGPKTWDISQKSIESYAEVLNKEGFPVTFFIVPDCASEQHELFKRMDSNGNECGIHIHPACWKNNYTHASDFKAIGGYDEETQNKIIYESIEQFKNSLGFTPKSFRGGFFSANNSTYSLLLRNGIKCGSTSLPGRLLKHKNSIWIGKRRDIHKVSLINRLGEGDSEFIDIPATTHLNRFGFLSKHGDIRMEKIQDITDFSKACIQSIEWQLKNKSDLLHLCFFTHNLFNFRAEPLNDMKNLSNTIKNAINALKELKDAYNLEIKGATISQARLQKIECSSRMDLKK